MKGPAVATAAVVVTPRNCEACLGLTWREIATLLEEKGVAIGHVGRRPYALVADVVAALDGVRARPWTDDDTRAELSRAGKAGTR